MNERKRPTPITGAGLGDRKRGRLPVLADDVIVALCNGLAVNFQQGDDVL